MTTEQKIERLTANIRKAENRAQRALEDGNDTWHRIHTDFADECRDELVRVLAEQAN